MFDLHVYGGTPTIGDLLGDTQWYLPIVRIAKPRQHVQVHGSTVQAYLLLIIGSEGATKYNISYLPAYHHIIITS